MNMNPRKKKNNSLSSPTRKTWGSPSLTETRRMHMDYFQLKMREGPCGTSPGVKVGKKTKGIPMKKN